MGVSKCVYGDEWMRRRFVPVIYLDNEKVGGFGELYKMHQNGQLTQNMVWFKIKDKNNNAQQSF